MVSSILVDAISNPTAALTDLFFSTTDVDTFPAIVNTHFSAIFNSIAAFKEIPVLNVHNPPETHKDRSLVRFCAMIQDTSSSPEMYLAKHKSGGCGGWGIGEDDAIVGTEDYIAGINYADLRECIVLWAVSIPGESSWCVDQVDQPLVPSSSNPSHSPSRPHKYPIPHANHIGVQVKIYDNPCSAEIFKSTDLCTFVGILTTELLHADVELSSPSPVPTLHVFFAQPIPPTLVPRIYPSLSTVGDVREELITWIADQSLAGDREAAEWVLLCVIARVQNRTPHMLPPSFTLSHFPSPDSTAKSSIPSLSLVLSYILPMLSTIPLSLPILNTTSFFPESKDEDLHAGWLQLPYGSVCVVTEAGITEGGVLERGLVNLRALQEMMSNQTLEYVFPYSRFTFNSDVSFLVLSEGRKSTFFQTTINVPLQPSGSANVQECLYKAADAIVLPTPEKLKIYQNLVGSAKVGSVVVNEEAAQYIQDDFISERRAMSNQKELPEGLTPEDLIHRMSVARLLALSLQEPEITIDIWKRTKILEAKRLAKIS